METEETTTETSEAPQTVTFEAAVMGIAELVARIKRQHRLSEGTALEILRMTMVYQQFPEESVSPLPETDVEGNVHEILTGEADGDSDSSD